MNSIFKKLITMAVIVGGFFAQQAMAANSLNFDGSSTSITIADANSDPEQSIFNTGNAMNSANENMALTFWIRTTATTGGVIFNRCDASGLDKDGYYAELVNTGEINVHFYGLASNSPDLKTDVTVNDGKWHHIAVVLNDDTLSIYVDGLQKAQTTSAGYQDGVLITDTPIKLGADQSGGNFFTGDLKDFRLYQPNSATTGSEITAENVRSIMCNSDGLYTMVDQNLLVRLALDDSTTGLTNTGTLGANQDGLSTGTITYADNFDAIRADHDNYTAIAGTEFTANVKDNDLDASDASVTVTAVKETNPANGTLNSFDAATGDFSYTPDSTFLGTDSFTYHLNDGTNDSATVTVTFDVLGEVFHYKLDEEPGSTTVLDSLGHWPASNQLPTSITLTGATGGSDLDPSDPSLNRTAEITTNDEGIEIYDAPNSNFLNGVTLICWVKPKVGGENAANTALLLSRVPGNNGGLRIAAQAATQAADEEISVKFLWNGTYGLTGGTVVTVKIGRWNFVAMTVTPTTGDVKLYAGIPTEDNLSTFTFNKAGFKTPPSITSVGIGMDTKVGKENLTFKGYIRDARMYNYPLPKDLTRAEGVTLEELFDNEKALVVTPVVGLELVQDGTTLTWTLESEIGVIEYQVIDQATGNVIQTVAATGEKSYSVTLPEGVKAKLVVRDNYGTQTYLPIDGNMVTTPYDLKKGWNLIAITGDHADLAPLKDAATGPLWAWNGSTYELATAPVATQAIWVNAKETKTVNVTAEKSTATITLTPGWTLAGPTNNEVIPAKAMSIFSYDETYNTISKEDEVLIRGVGYWIFSL